ncbi:MAG TPA: MBL fold metallo-hydrolase [Chitinophagales bacterium]|nr:MBL fold metallo-hydrolase [Chitinophagales bacterium]
MEVVFLGTGTSGGVPMVGCESPVCLSENPKDKRLRSSVLIRTQGKTLAIDCSPDFRQQMLRENVKRLDAILFTHAHKDHTAGLDDVRGFNYVMKKAIPLYMNQETFDSIRKHYDYIFNGNDYPGIPQVDIKIIDNAPFMAEGIPVTPIEVMHYRLKVFAYRIEDFTYITDANFISKQEMEKIKGSRVVVINALRKEPHVSHYNLKQAIEVIQELKPQQAYLTHISHQLGFHDEVNKELPNGIELAYDGLKFNV